MNELREELAALIHEIRAGWTGSFFSQCIEVPQHPWASADQTLKVRTIIPERIVDRWTRQMQSVYVVLPEEEKESDRTQADRILAIFERYKGEEAVTETRVRYEDNKRMSEPEPWGLWNNEREEWWIKRDGHPFLTESLLEAKMKLFSVRRSWPAEPWRVRSAREWQRTLYDTSLVEEGPCASPPL